MSFHKRPSGSPEPKVLINMSNLRRGGALQVAASVVDELAALISDQAAFAEFPWLASLEVWASTAVIRECKNSSLERLNLSVFDKTFNFAGLLRRPVDVSFMVFGGSSQSRV